MYKEFPVFSSLTLLGFVGLITYALWQYPYAQ